jgi:hypothetical protein
MRTFEEIENLALTNKYISIRNHDLMEIELVNIEQQTIICLTRDKEYEHIHYSEITDEDMFFDGDRVYTIKIPEIHYVNIEVYANNIQEAKNIAEQIYNDSKIPNEPVFEFAYAKEKWIVDY